MKSPFPGMDPYLEDPAFFRDFHHKFINYWQEQIADVLPDHYEARLGENVYLCEEVLEVESIREPDVMVLQSRRRSRGASKSSGGLATISPVTVPLVVPVEHRQGYIKLIHRQTRNVVTVLELLSPANKNEPGRTKYLEKRDELIEQNVHIVELDLLIKGHRAPLAEPLPHGDYFYLVSRGDRRPHCEVFPWNMAAPLPIVPVPLQAPDPDIFCDLGALFALVYERGRYHKAIEYRKDPPLKLSAAQKKWVRQQVRAAKT